MDKQDKATIEVDALTALIKKQVHEEEQHMMAKIAAMEKDIEEENKAINETKELGKFMDLVRETEQKLVDIVNSKESSMKTGLDASVQLLSMTKVNLLKVAKDQNMATVNALEKVRYQNIKAVIDMKENATMLAATKIDDGELLKLPRGEKLDTKKENKRLMIMSHVDVANTSKKSTVGLLTGSTSTEAAAAAGTGMTMQRLNMVFNKLVTLEKMMTILIIGFQGSGKKTIIDKLKVLEDTHTVQFGGELAVEYHNINFVVCDLDAKPVRTRFYNNVAAFVFVVDSTENRSRILQARYELHQILHQDETNQAPLIFANKQDLPVAINVGEISNALDVGSNISRLGSVATSGIGLVEGLEWLSTAIAKKAVQP